MNEDNGKEYVAEYTINEDTLTTYLPDGTSKDTELRGLDPKSAAKVHLLSYIKINT